MRRSIGPPYDKPSTVFARYRDRDVKSVAAELDPIFEAIVRHAISTG